MTTLDTRQRVAAPTELLCFRTGSPVLVNGLMRLGLQQPAGSWLLWWSLSMPATTVICQRGGFVARPEPLVKSCMPPPGYSSSSASKAPLVAASDYECPSAMQVCAVLAVYRCIMTSVAGFDKELALLLRESVLGGEPHHPGTDGRGLQCCRWRHAGCGRSTDLRHANGQGRNCAGDNWLLLK